MPNNKKERKKQRPYPNHFTFLFLKPERNCWEIDKEPHRGSSGKGRGDFKTVINH